MGGREDRGDAESGRQVAPRGACLPLAGADALEPPTDELLGRLLASTDVEGYLSRLRPSDTTLSAYLARLLEGKSLTRADVIRASGLNATFCYQVFQGTRRPGRDHAIMLAFGLSCTLYEAQRLLRCANVSELWCKTRRDAIVIFCIERGRTREQCDDELWRLGEPTLLPGEG